jgi:OmpA-OmpF porin, OOP family
VVGHTDNVGNFDSNTELSKRRAQAVVSKLEANYGIDKKRLTPVGVSYACPVAPNTTEDGRAKNRRVELVGN